MSDTQPAEKTGKASSIIRLEPSEEADLITQSNELKTNANARFGASSFEDAVVGYNKAIDVLPSYLDYEIAVLKSNIAACHIKLSEWKEAIEAATAALDGLDLIDPLPKPKRTEPRKNIDEVDEPGKSMNDAAQVIEVDDMTAERLAALERSGKTITDVQKIRVKVLLRRSKARSELGGWSNLQGAEEDYKLLTTLPQVSATDRNNAHKSIQDLRPRLEEAKNTEMGEMMGKLKQLGNGILKPFGLSTDNFQMIQDPKTGGYNLQFNQNK